MKDSRSDSKPKEAQPFWSSISIPVQKKISPKLDMLIRQQEKSSDEKIPVFIEVNDLESLRQMGLDLYSEIGSEDKWIVTARVTESQILNLQDQDFVLKVEGSSPVHPVGQKDSTRLSPR